MISTRSRSRYSSLTVACLRPVGDFPLSAVPAVRGQWSIHQLWMGCHQYLSRLRRQRAVGRGESWGKWWFGNWTRRYVTWPGPAVNGTDGKIRNICDSMKRLLFSVIITSTLLPLSRVMAYNYAGYRWGGSNPSVGVDTSRLYLTGWQQAVASAMGSWNQTGSRLTIYPNNSSGNKMDLYTEQSDVLAYAPSYRAYGWWGNVVRADIHINGIHP